MTRYQNNDRAPYGVYFSSWPLDVRFVGADGETLSGRSDASYVRIPTLLALLLSPAMGGAFVMAFPVLIFAALFTAAGSRLVKVFRGASSEHAYLAMVQWQPAAAALSRPEGEREDKDEDMADLAERVREARDAENEEA